MQRHAQRPCPAAHVQQRAREGTDKEELPEEGASGGNLHAPHHPVYSTALPAFAIGGVVDAYAKHRASHANHHVTAHANQRACFLFCALPLPIIPEPRRLVWARKGSALAPGAQTPIPRIEEAGSKYIGQVLPRVTMLQLPCPKRSACPCIRAHVCVGVRAKSPLNPKLEGSAAEKNEKQKDRKSEKGKNKTKAKNTTEAHPPHSPATCLRTCGPLLLLLLLLLPPSPCRQQKTRGVREDLSQPDTNSLSQCPTIFTNLKQILTDSALIYLLHNVTI